MIFVHTKMLISTPIKDQQTLALHSATNLFYR